jgi:hypothetical protein
MRFAILALITLAACAEVVPNPPTTDGQACGADPDSALIGQSADVLAAMIFPAPMRIIRPGMAVTMDYNPNRLNIDIDKHNKIVRVWCG